CVEFAVGNEGSLPSPRYPASDGAAARVWSGANPGGTSANGRWQAVFHAGAGEDSQRYAGEGPARRRRAENAGVLCETSATAALKMHGLHTLFLCVRREMRGWFLAPLPSPRARCPGGSRGTTGRDWSTGSWHSRTIRSGERARMPPIARPARRG